MNDIFEDLIDAGVIGANSRTIFTIQGGYFEAEAGPDHFSSATLKKALEIGEGITKFNPNHSIKYDLLINDLGITCNSDYCNIIKPTDQKNINKSIEAATEIAKMRGATFRTTTERHMRNWGFRRLKKIFKSPDWMSSHPNLVSMMGNEQKQWILNSATGTNIVLFEEKGLSWIAKCPLIMGAYYSYLVEDMKKHPWFDASVVIDLCAPNDRDKVSKGAETALRILLNNTNGVALQPVICDPNCHSMIPIIFTAKDF